MLSLSLVKYVPKTPLGQMQTITPPIAVLEDISMDFIIRLPTFEWHSVVMIIIDKFPRQIFLAH